MTTWRIVHISGFSGSHCEQPLNPCLLKPCRNGGRCHATNQQMYSWVLRLFFVTHNAFRWLYLRMPSIMLGEKSKFLMSCGKNLSGKVLNFFLRYFWAFKIWLIFFSFLQDLILLSFKISLILLSFLQNSILLSFKIWLILLSFLQELILLSFKIWLILLSFLQELILLSFKIWLILLSFLQELILLPFKIWLILLSLSTRWEMGPDLHPKPKQANLILAIFYENLWKETNSLSWQRTSLDGWPVVACYNTMGEHLCCSNLVNFNCKS